MLNIGLMVRFELSDAFWAVNISMIPMSGPREKDDWLVLRAKYYALRIVGPWRELFKRFYTVSFCLILPTIPNIIDVLTNSEENESMSFCHYYIG